MRVIRQSFLRGLKLYEYDRISACHDIFFTLKPRSPLDPDKIEGAGKFFVQSEDF